MFDDSHSINRRKLDYNFHVYSCGEKFLVYFDAMLSLVVIACCCLLRCGLKRFYFRVGTSLDVCVEKLNLSGKMQLVLNLDSSTSFPHISSVSVTFLEKLVTYFHFD
jgi:hypothetical protein